MHYFINLLIISSAFCQISSGISIVGEWCFFILASIKGISHPQCLLTIFSFQPLISSAGSDLVNVTHNQLLKSEETKSESSTNVTRAIPSGILISNNLFNSPSPSIIRIPGTTNFGFLNPLGNFISSTPAIISEPTQQSPITKPSAPSSEATVTQEISQASDVLESGNKMNSPMVGTFYSAPNPESEPFVKVGDQINEGDVLCIIEAMKMMNEVKSEFSGTVKQILVDNAEPVEFDQTLFVIS